MILAVGLPFVMALLLSAVGGRLGRQSGFLSALAFAPALALGLALWQGHTPSETWHYVSEWGLNLSLRGESLSLLFAVMIGTIGVLTSVYSVFYLSGKENFARFYAYLLAFGGSMLGLVLSDNLVALFGFWEMTSITSFLLIGLWHPRAAARDGATKALLVSVLGGLGLLAAVAMLSLGGGSLLFSQLDLVAFRQSPYFVPALLLTLLAAFTKSAQLPFHLWLPTAMEAPTPVSAFLHSATMVKAGVFLVAKFGVIFAGPLWSGIVVPVGLLTLCWGSWLALRQTDLKALLAFSTISQLGLLMSLYGLADTDGRFAATTHLLNHAAFKAALFFVVGIIDHEAKTREIPLLSGLRRRMPKTFVLALLATLSMAGLPPLGGFLSKELFYETLWHAHPALLAVAVLGSALTFAYCARLLSVFWGQEYRPAHVHDAGLGLLLPAGVLVGLALLFGLWPHGLEQTVRHAGLGLGFADYHGHVQWWHGLTPAFIGTLLTWALGAALVWQAGAVERVQERLTPSWNANTVYYALIRTVHLWASALMIRTQGLPLPAQLRLMLLFMMVVAGTTLVQVPLRVQVTPWLPMHIWPVAALLVAGAVGVVIARNRLTAVVVTGLTGLGSAAAFLLLRAPDLALTQLLVEAVTVMLFLLAFRYLPGVHDKMRSRSLRLFDAALAIVIGVGSAALLLGSVHFLAPSISPYYLAHSYEGGGGKNVVNVLLVDFRGYDTLGEGLVVGMVALAVSSLVALGRVKVDKT